MKVYLDENLSPRIAEGLQARGIDATSAHEVGNTSLDDRSQLGHAAREGRAIVSANIVDFMMLAQEAVAANAHHAGIVVVPSAFQLYERGALVDAIEVLAQRYPAGIADSVLVVSRRRS